LGELVTTSSLGDTRGSGILDASDRRAALRELLILRCLAAPAALAIMLVATKLYHLALPLPELLPGVVVLVLYAGYTAYLLRRPRPVSEAVFSWQLVLDLQVISYLLYCCGGGANPFASLYVVPLTIAAVYLPWPHIGLITAVTLGDYAFLDIFGHPGLQMANGSPVPDGILEVAAEASYLLTGVQVVFFVTRLAATSRSRAAAVTAAREQQLNDRLVVAIGALAAGAAHEMATPLSTIAVLVKELRSGRGNMQNGLDTIARQVGACKQALRHLAEAAKPSHGESPRTVALDRFLESVAGRFRVLRPDADLRTDWAIPAPAPAVREDATLSQSIITLLNNAADASREPVQMNGYLRDDMLVLEVADRGPGISTELAERLGRPFVSTKGQAQGMGIGLFLAKTAVEGLGGALAFLERPGGGTCVTMTLPLAALLAGDP